MNVSVNQRWLRYAVDENDTSCSYVIEITKLGSKTVSGKVIKVIIPGFIFPSVEINPGIHYDFFSIDPNGSDYQEFIRGGKIDGRYTRLGGHWKLLKNQDICQSQNT